MLPPLGDQPTPPPSEDRDTDVRSVSRLTRGIAAVAVAGALAVGGLAATGTLGGSSSDPSADDDAAPTAVPADATQAVPAPDDAVPQDDWGVLGESPTAPTGSAAPPVAGSGGS